MPTSRRPAHPSQPDSDGTLPASAVERVYRHTRTAILMGHARGVLLLAAQRKMLPVHSFLATEVKQVVAGNGHASKSSVQQAVRARLRLSAPPNPPDVADALAIAICFALRRESASDVAAM